MNSKQMATLAVVWLAWAPTTLAAFGERVRQEHIEPGVRAAINSPSRVDEKKPTVLVIYATPNGSSIEQTLGQKVAAGGDWRMEIQHVAAQVRRLREVDGSRNIVLAVVEAEGRSWPAWRAKHVEAPAIVRAVVEKLKQLAGGKAVSIVLTGHSGGGAFTWAYLDGGATIPDEVERIALLDSNYSYSDEKGHGDKLVAWLKGPEHRRLAVVAYDDREVELEGRKIVGPTGGTWRASERMLARLAREGAIEEANEDPFGRKTAMGGRAKFYLHPNPDRKVLHSALVGEMNGLLHALAVDTPAAGKWGVFGGPRAYQKWVAERRGGREVLRRIADLPLADREAVIVDEILGGNVPAHLRRFVKVKLKSGELEGAVEVIPDYLAVGTDDDWVRTPLTPMAAARVAEAWGCALPTRKMVDAAWEQAAVKLEPQPLTEQREAITTFVQHHELIQAQSKNPAAGTLVAGIKKDVVVSNRLKEKPGRVAIYGWHKLDGKPIQPLTIVHRDTYVDYSHGVRLVKVEMDVGGKRRTLADVLKDPAVCGLVSDEGVIDAAYSPPRH